MRLSFAAALLSLAACFTMPAEAVGAPLGLEMAPVTVVEGQKACATIHKTGGNGRSVKVSWSTSKGTAIARRDFILAGGTLTLGSVDATVCVKTVDDKIGNGTRTFQIKAQVLSGTPRPSAYSVVTITENDSLAAPPPPPPPTTKTCWDDSVIPITSICPDPPPPPPTMKNCPDGTVIPVAQTCPEVPTFTPDPSIAPSLSGLPDIPSNFDRNAELLDQTSPPARVDQIGHLSDPQGAFRFLCNAGQILYDDPIVKPGQPGAAHLHQFYGNTSANAYSTFATLRTTGESTCFSKLNRSAYWMPALLDGKGNVLRPDFVAIYYKRFPLGDPRCTDPTNMEFFGYCRKLPNGLRFIAGFNMQNPDSPISTFQWFNCQGPTAQPGIYPDIPTTAPHCPAGQGNQFGFVISMPDCWDGVHLDTTDHHSHMVPHGTGVIYNYADGTRSHTYTGAPLGPAGVTAYEKCPPTHPYVLPTFTIGAWYSVLADDDPSLFSLSSDAIYPLLPKGKTLHADWYGAWDPIAINDWQDHCIDEYRSCENGNLGTNKALKSTGFTWSASPHKVPVPAMPGM